MAKNIIHDPAHNLSVVVTDPAIPASGDPVRFGSLTGIALVNEGDGGNAATETTCNFGQFIADIPVKAEAAAINVGDALFYDDGISAVNNDSVNGYFYGFALEAIGNGETVTINVLHTPSPGAGSLASDSVTTAKIANGAVTEVKISAATLTGLIAKVVANANVIGGLPLLHRIDIAAGANADTDVVLTHKTRVIDAWLVLTGAGVASAVLTVKNGAVAITDGMAASGSDKALVRCATIDDAQHEIAAGGTLRVTGSAGATQPAATVYVLGVRVV